jgi:hypothetical protein
VKQKTKTEIVQPADRAANDAIDNALVPMSSLTAWERALQAPAEQAVNKLGSEVRRLKIAGKVFKSGDDGIYGDYADVIITGFAPAHVYRDQPYSANAEPTEPVCWATAELTESGLPDSDENALRAHPGVPSRQALRCADCRLNQWGTATNGGRGKACSLRMYVTALVVGGEKIGSCANPQACTAVMIDLSSTGQREFVKYVRNLQERGALYCSVISRVTFSDRETYPLPVWEPLAPVPPTFKDRIHALVESSPKLVTASPWALNDVPDDRTETATGASGDDDIPFA